ncbi:hypothetical protein JCM18899A_48850 [Nocardioides sp. AN3]
MDVVGKAVTVGDDPRDIDRHAPLLGEHSAEILAEIGVAADVVEALVAEGVVVRTEEVAPV